MQAGKTIRGDQQLAAREVTVGQGAYQGVQRGRDVFRRGHRAGRRADQVAPALEKPVADIERLRPLRVVGRTPERRDALQRVGDALRLAGKQADGMIEEISGAIVVAVLGHPASIWQSAAMSTHSDAFDHWIRGSFMEINTELENLYFAQDDRADVSAGEQLKARLRDEGHVHVVALLAEGDTGDGFST